MFPFYFSLFSSGEAGVVWSTTYCSGRRVCCVQVMNLAISPSLLTCVLFAGDELGAVGPGLQRGGGPGENFFSPHYFWVAVIPVFLADDICIYTFVFK